MQREEATPRLAGRQAAIKSRIEEEASAPRSYRTHLPAPAGARKQRRRRDLLSAGCRSPSDVGSRIEQRGGRAASIARLPDLPPSRRCDPAVPWMQRKGGAAPGGLSGASSGRGCAPFFDCPPLWLLWLAASRGRTGFTGSSLFCSPPRRRQQPAEQIRNRLRGREEGRGWQIRIAQRPLINKV